MSKEPALVVPTELNDRQKRFCWEFVHGKHSGNATRSYRAIYDESSIQSASACASALLKDPRTVRYLAKLRREAAEKRLKDLLPWSNLVGEAQATLLAIMRGEVRSRLMLESAREVLDRALGRASQRLEHELLRDEEQVNRALKLLAQRKATDGTRGIHQFVKSEAAAIASLQFRYLFGIFASSLRPVN